MDADNEFYKVLHEYYGRELRAILAPSWVWKLEQQTDTYSPNTYSQENFRCVFGGSTFPHTGNKKLNKLPPANKWSYAAQVNFGKLIRGM